MDKKKFSQYLEGIKNAPYLAIDTESNGKELRYEDGTGKTLGLSVAFRVGTFPIFRAYFPFRHFDWNYPIEYLQELKEVIEAHPCVVFHNAKHDLAALENFGIYVTGKFYDTMLIAHLLNENYFSKGLDYLSKLLLGDAKDRSKDMDGFIKGFGWGLVPSYMIQEYAAHDAYLTLMLLEYFLPLFQEEGLDGEVWDDRQKFTRLIKRMEGRGVLIDKELCEKELAIGLARMEDIKEDLDLNPGSGKDLEELLINRMNLPVVKLTPNGGVSFNKEAMEKYEELLEKQDNPLAKLILEYRGWQKTCSSNYKSYLTLASNDGRLRANYRLHGTVTGRLSCYDPNLQQIPRTSDKQWNGKLKKAFIPEMGYNLYEADYAQLELRLAAAYAKEEDLLEIFLQGRDVFTEMSKQLGMERFTTKTLTYTIQYGGGVNRISDVFNVSRSRAEEIRDNFYETYPKFRAVSQRAAQVARNKGYIKLWSGRRRHFELPKEEARKAFNATIQGGAADIVMKTMLRLGDEVDSDDCRMLLQIHDSVVFEIRNGKEDLFLPKIKSIMEDVRPDFGVKFAVDIHKWGEG